MLGLSNIFETWEDTSTTQVCHSEKPGDKSKYNVLVTSNTGSTKTSWCLRPVMAARTEEYKEKLFANNVNKHYEL